MPQSTARILLADDRTDKLMAMEAVLTPLNVEIVKVRSGAEALEAVAAHEFAAVLLDVRMPVMDGFETARRIRELPRGRVLPIIFVSAAETPDLIEQGYALGAVDYIKELVPQILRAKVSVFVDLYRQRMDLTERKVIEEELRKAKAEAETANAAKDHFLAALSHELRTPLTPVVALLPTILASEGLTEEMRNDLLMIQRNVQLETHLINDLLDLTLITKGRLHLNLQRTDAHAALRRVLQITTSEAAAKEIQVETDLGASDFHVWGDPARLDQVFWTLLRNAIKFSSTGQTVCIKTSNSHPAVLRVDVIDDGVGLDPAQLKRIFKAFEQPHDSAGHRFGGLGVGLYISQSIAAQHGTSIQAISRGQDCGSTFRIELRTTNAPQDSGDESAFPDDSTKQSLRILLVEDHDNTRQVLTRLLTNSGHEVKAAQNVQTAMELAEGYEFDLIISDLGLPDGSGLELMPELKQRYGLKGIAVSGYGREEDLQKSRLAGFSAHLIKPLNFEDLELTVSRVVALGDGAER